MNGRVGRARELARIKRNRLREAAAAGVDVSDRAAVEQFHNAEWNKMIDRVFAAKSAAERETMKR